MAAFTYTLHPPHYELPTPAEIVATRLPGLRLGYAWINERWHGVDHAGAWITTPKTRYDLRAVLYAAVDETAFMPTADLVDNLEDYLKTQLARD